MIIKEYEKLKDLTNDQLRELSKELKTEIHRETEPEEQQIAQLREEAEKEDDVNKKEELYNELTGRRSLLTRNWKKSGSYIAQSFCNSKETARRFKEILYLRLLL